MALTSIPNYLTPIASVMFDGSLATVGPAVQAYRALLIGQKITAGTGSANLLYRVTSADQVAVLAGRGSQLHRMAKQYFQRNKFTETYIGILVDGAGVAATNTLTLTGAATAAGVLALYVAGRYIPAVVSSGDTVTIAAAAVAAAVNADVDCAVTAAAAAGVVTFTNKNKGVVGNETDIRLGYQDTDAVPTGLTAVLTAPAGGTVNPVLTTLIANMGDTQFHIIANPYTDATSLTALETELADRWGPARQIEGHMISAKSDTLANTATFTAGRNSKHSTILRVGLHPTAVEEAAANVAAIVAYEGAISPARPFTSLQTDILPQTQYDQDTRAERDVILQNGGATLRPGAGGVTQIERLVTTYRTNAAGTSDATFRDMNTLLQLSYGRYNLRVRWGTRYPRHMLGADGPYPAGEPVMTPKLAKAELVSWFLDMSTSSPVVFDAGALAQFKRDLVVQINGSDPNRLDVLAAPDLINQLLVSAFAIQFRL